MNDKKQTKTTMVGSAKECALIGVYVAVLLSSQLVLAVVPGVEVVTALFAVFAFCFGAKRAVAVATAFSLLRQFVFGFFPTVLILYLVYYNTFALVFAFLGKKLQSVGKGFPVIIVSVCVCSVLFTLLDCVITPLFYAFTKRATIAYFYSALPIMTTQTVAVGITTAVLFLPLYRAFSIVKRSFFCA